MQLYVCAKDNGASRARHSVRPALCAHNESRDRIAIPCVAINRHPAGVARTGCHPGQIGAWCSWIPVYAAPDKVAGLARPPRRIARDGLRVQPRVLRRDVGCEARLTLRHLPRGLTEIYFHLATRDGFENCGQAIDTPTNSRADGSQVIALTHQPDATLCGYSGCYYATAYQGDNRPPGTRLSRRQCLRDRAASGRPDAAGPWCR